MPHQVLVVNGNVAIDGSLTISGSITADSDNTADTLGNNGSTELHDLAEDIPAADDVEPGDVVAIDPDNDERVVKANKPYDPAVLGVISTSPAFHINMKDSDTPLALAGRVPCKVSIENGPIRRGDLLTSSSTPGFAMKATRDGPVIGKALEEFDGSEGEQGKIVIFMNLGWWGGPPEERQLVSYLAEETQR